MDAISNCSKNLFSKESALQFAGNVGAGLLSSRFLPVSLKGAGVVSVAAGTLSTMGQAFLDKDASPFKKGFVITGAFALTYFAAAALAPTLSAKFAITLTPQVIGKILAFNALGQVVSFAITKFLFVTPWNGSDDHIKSLYETYTKDTDLFSKLPAIEQQLIVQRFEKLELDVTAFTFTAEEPSSEEIAALSASDVRTLHQHEVVVKEDALLIRYFELDLKPFEAIEKRIPKLELKQPETVEEAKALSEEKLAWYKLHYAKNNSAISKLPYDVQWALHEAECTTTYFFNASYLQTAPDKQIHNLVKSETSLSWWVSINPDVQKALVKRAEGLEIEIPHSVHPTTPDEVKALDEETVKAYNETLRSELKEEVINAFHVRFYQMKLPLPNGLTISTINKDKKPKYPAISLTPPSSISEVEALHENQVAWHYCSHSLRGGFSKLPFEVQSALNCRFNDLLNWRFWFTFSQLTAENVQQAPQTAIEIIHDQLNKKLDEWKKLPVDVIRALDARFAECCPTKDLSEDNIRNYHKLFVERQDCWNALAGNRRQVLRKAFDAFPELKELKVGSSWS